MVRAWGTTTATAFAVMLSACDKPADPPPAKATPEVPTIAITGTPPTPPAASSVASAAPVPAASETAAASVSAPATPAFAGSATGKGEKPSAAAVASASKTPPTSASSKVAAAATPPEPAKEPAPALKPASQRLAGKNFTLDVASPGCRVDTTCTMTLRLAPTGEFHVNKEYPYKFVATAVPGVAFQGNGEANVFSRSAGDFREEGEKAATMTVRFKPSATGDAKVSGVYKMSVCSAEACQIEQQAVTLAVPVM